MEELGNNMTDNKIVKAIMNALMDLDNEYFKNHKLKKPSKSNVRIGRSNSVSYVFERKLAKRLGKVFRNYYFFVDYPITLYDKNNTKIKQVYPDIFVVKGLDMEKKDSEGKAVAIIDLKIDLGYLNLDHYGISKDGRQIENKNSNFVKREDALNKCDLGRFDYIVGAYSDEEKQINKEKGKLKVKIPKNILKISIISTKDNAHGRLEIYRKILEKQGYSVLFLLNEKTHLNSDHKLPEKIIDKQLPKKEIIKAFRGL